MFSPKCASCLVCGMLVVGISGCVSNKIISEEPKHPEILKAEELFDAGRYADAIVAVSELARREPQTPGLAGIQAKIMKRLAEERRKGYDKRAENTSLRVENDVRIHSVVPDTYRFRRMVKGETSSLRSTASRMQKALSKNVTVHLDEVGISEFAAQISETQGINIIADSNLGNTIVTIHAADTPLVEILEYVGRNLGVEFSVGDNLIWATKSVSGGGTLPLETRIYRLRKGLSGDEIIRPSSSGSKTSGASSSSGGEGEPSVIEIMQRFVEQPQGADILYNAKAHVLIVKNTRDNLVKSEELIDTLDVTPPQVLIEARFISTSITDLSELGVDWVLNSAYETSSKMTGFDSKGNPIRKTETEITDASLIGSSLFTGATSGGNFTFQGVLTDPKFKAVVHMLQSSGKARTLSVPRVTTINNRPAKIRVGKDVRYYEEYDLEEFDVETSDGDTMTRTQLVPSGTPTLEEIGIELSVTPSVGADLSSIDLALIPEISDIIGWEYFEASSDSGNNGSNTNGTGRIKLPIFSRNTIETEVIVRSGDTVVMGGLISSTKQKEDRGVPILSKLPLIGALFRSTIETENNENLIIFVTATIISEIGEELIPINDLAPESEESAPITGTESNDSTVQPDDTGKENSPVSATVAEPLPVTQTETSQLPPDAEI